MKELFLKQLDKLPLSKGERTVITNALNLSEKSHASFYRFSGAPYIDHAISVASLVAEWNAPSYVIAAALLHDVTNSTFSNPPSAGEILAACGENVEELVKESAVISKIRTSPLDETGNSQLDSIERISLTYPEIVNSFNQFPHALILRIANHLENAATIEFTSKDDQGVFARVALNLLGPLSTRLGMDFAKRELEDIGFGILDPQAASKIAEKYPNDAIFHASAQNLKTLEDQLARNRIDASISLAPRSVYSLYRRWLESGGTDSAYYTLETAKSYLVVVNSLTECYVALGVLHNKFKPIVGQFRDYIATPKINGYRALHTKLRVMQGVEIDVLIRDQEMQKIAEFGVINNWEYSAPKLDILTPNSKTHEIVIFTPAGNPKVMPANSTPVDFAYSIHSQLGAQCIGAFGNGKPLALDKPLEPFMSVKIITDRNTIGPETKWLNSVKTILAKTEIEKYYGIKKFDEAIDKGRQILIDTLDTMSANYSFQELSDRLNVVCLQKECTLGQLLTNIERGKNNIEEIIQLLTYDDVTKITTETLRPTFTVITILGKDRSGLVADITGAASRLGINLESIAAFKIADHLASMRITVNELESGELESLKSAIRSVDGVRDIYISDRQPMSVLRDGPYPLAPAQGAYFKGRDKELKSLVEDFLIPGRSALVWGPRRIGKTSLLFELPNHLDQNRYLPVSIDLQNAKDDSTLGIIDAIIKGITKINPGIHAPKWSTIKKNPLYSLDSFITRSISPDQILVLTIDECTILTELKEKRESALLSRIDLLRYFRNQIQHNKQIRFVFSGGGVFRNIMDSEGLSSLLELSALMELTYLDKDDSKKIISDSHIIYETDATAKILEVTANHLLTANHPGYIQILCNELTLKYGNFINLQMVNEWIETYLRRLPVHNFSNLWGNSLGLSNTEQVRCLAVFFIIAQESTLNDQVPEQIILESELKQYMSPTNISRALNHLKAIRTIVQLNGMIPIYQIELKLAILWLTKHFSFKEIILEYSDILKI